MPTYEASISISASREAVWRALSDVAAWPQWLPTVTAVQPLDGAALKLGHRYLVHQPKLRPATWVVVELDQSGRFVWHARSPGLLMVAEHTVRETGPGTSVVELRYSFSGLLGGLIGRLFRSITESYLAAEAASVKRKAEAER
jgi:uncharacterized protein YndB with AHSA1/START domain